MAGFMIRTDMDADDALKTARKVARNSGFATERVNE